MSFLAPMAFAFAAAIPVLVVFYLLKRKRVVKLVSSTLLWQRFLAETQASTPFQKLRHNWLLILQILLVMAVILALARPYFSGKVVGGRLFVVILDASASMQSRDEEPSRFERARREALAFVDSLHASDQTVLLLAADHAEVKQSPTTSKSALRRAIGDCRVSDAPTRLGEAFKLAQPLVKDRADAEIHLYSDGAASDLEEFEHEGLRVVFHRVGSRARNAGVVSLDVRPHPEDPARRAVFAGLANASSNRVETEVELRFNDGLVETRSVAMEPRETVPLVFATSQAENGIFEVRMTFEDDLEADNRASVVSLLPEPVDLLLVTRGNRYLQRALVAAGNTRVAVASDVADGAGGFGVTVVDDVLPAAWPSNNVLAVRTVPPGAIEITGRQEVPAIVDWMTTHPLLRSVGLDNVQIDEALVALPPPWATAVVEAPGAPLILAGEFGRQRVVWIAFDLLQSSWPLRVSFPMFIANAVDWLNPATARRAELLVPAGSPLRWQAPADVTNATVRLPDGSERVVPVAAGSGVVVFGDTGRRGVYQLQAGTNAVTFCVNLLDARETDTAPQSELRFGRYARVVAGADRRASLELWRWLALAGLVVCFGEWWFYHRRTA
ncbi:MAG TPA: BatA and WFA domain-containing protein [Verrucomicrobiota bacterium]|nr:BatA and WFA domain-containing protein [Verrucomicrobiota bacterium]HNU50992.1 BatA and WFA domain-containing protein [Verrucomicrobiota bacterium]